MLNLFIKDYIFSKKILLFSFIYCLAVPIIISLDHDARYYLADFLIPIALVTAPLVKLMQREDTKSGLIFQKTLPYSAYKRVGARFAFVMSLLALSGIILSGVKQFIFKIGSFGELFKASIPALLGFAAYFTIYMTVFYWKGYFATQFCIYILIIGVVMGKKLINEDILRLIKPVMENKTMTALAIVGFMIVMYIISCLLEQRRKLDTINA